MNILILTGRFGMGHYSTSISLKQEILRDMEGSNVEIIDIVDYMTPKFQKIIYSGFNLLVQKASGLYNFVYKNTTDTGLNKTIPFVKVLVSKIEKLIDLTNPDIIISTLPLCSKIISEYKERTGSNLPLVTCITDISTHNEWINQGTDLYLVATEMVKENLIKSGVSSRDILISGIPVKEQFKELYNKRIKKRKNHKKLLIMGGGLGLIPLNNSFYDILSRVDGLEVTVIMGRNKKAYDRLFGRYDNIQVIGYTDKVYEYMADSDLLISKAGGITLFEAIHAELPMLVLCPFLAQEKNNAYFIENKGIGRVLWDKYMDMSSVVLDILNNDSYLSEMQDNMNKIKSTLNNRTILDMVSRIEGIGVA
ncbi:MGDG synthase family glycosyltransferase [Tissierellaceae bacterium HCP3S3_D8]